jgi:hypothetical protein
VHTTIKDMTKDHVAEACRDNCRATDALVDTIMNGSGPRLADALLERNDDGRQGEGKVTEAIE